MAIQESLDGGDDHKEAWLNLAALHHKHGTLEDAIWHYDRTAKAVLGQERYDALPAAMHYSDGDFFAEIAKDSETYELLVMILNNVGQAMSQQGKVRAAANREATIAQMARFLVHYRLHQYFHLYLISTISDNASHNTNVTSHPARYVRRRSRSLRFTTGARWGCLMGG